jgi:hypothetical protein
LIDLVHRSEETAGVLDMEDCTTVAGAGGPQRQRWWRAAAALEETIAPALGDETTTTKMNAAALETKTKTKKLPDPGQLCAYIGEDPLAPVRS